MHVQRSTPCKKGEGKGGRKWVNRRKGNKDGEEGGGVKKSHLQRLVGSFKLGTWTNCLKVAQQQQDNKSYGVQKSKIYYSKCNVYLIIYQIF